MASHRRTPDAFEDLPTAPLPHVPRWPADPVWIGPRDAWPILSERLDPVFTDGPAERPFVVEVRDWMVVVNLIATLAIMVALILFGWAAVDGAMPPGVLPTVTPSVAPHPGATR